MSYKVDFQKALKVINSTNPKYILILGVAGSMVRDFATNLSKMNYNIFYIPEISRQTAVERLDKIPDIPTVVAFEFSEVDITVGDIFPDDIYTVVYMYPNNVEEHKQRLELDEIGEIRRLNRKSYKEYIEKYDNRILTVLV